MQFGSAFTEILDKRQMPLSVLADRSGFDESKLKAVLDGKEEVTDELAANVADALGVPTRALFATSAQHLSSIPDFRRRVPSRSLLEPEAIKAIAFVERISLTLSALGIDFSSSNSLHKHSGPLTRAAAEDLAYKWRRRWGITEEQQLEWRDANKVYGSLREFVEGLGIFVIHFKFGTDTVSGLYAKVDRGPHTILINTFASSKARKLFTLAHEFCHVILGADGVSNSASAKNKTEAFCNKFAAALLAPASLMLRALKRYGYEPSLSDDLIRLLARNVGISQQACVLRLSELGLVEASSYRRWMSQFSGKAPDGDLSDGGGGGGVDPIQAKRTQFGRSFINKLAYAYNEGILDDIGIYRLSGIKPKYQSALFEAR
ncbi:ImmA/IrrE family metallo-endopeptidase [Tabrizicola sp. M-4]|uniref:ImmA/IrrE family metallo-endopeptidase n=1 Tax=Tabrizicola sp. M-4 TaxID=3055847 RepID=UPI003DA9089A